MGNTRGRLNATVSRGGEILAEAQLPLPQVHYPLAHGHYFGFAIAPDTTPYLCECFKSAMDGHSAALGWTGYREYLAKVDSNARSNFARNNFPPAITNRLLGLRAMGDFDSLFRTNICHACNQIIPTLASSGYPHASFTYERLYWYVKQARVRDGLGASFQRFSDFFAENPERFQLATGKARNERETYKRCLRQYFDETEMATKERFGLQGLGGSSQAEHILLNMVRALFPGDLVQHKVRPKWLENLELDIWVPRLNLGIEYQGEQHYMPVEHWGGEEAFERQIARDKQKRLLCKQNGTTLLEIRYDQHVDIDALEKLIAKAIA